MRSPITSVRGGVKSDNITYNQINIVILDIIYPPVFYLKHIVSEA
jgi:hypothetical protein